MQTGQRIARGEKGGEVPMKLPLQNNCAFEPQKKFFGLHSG